jgi:transposase-like protein
LATINAVKSININGLVDEAKCYQTVRELRWKEGLKCAWCNSPKVVKNGHTKATPECQKYCCQNFGRYFDDLTNTIFSGHHQPLSIWILCLYFMGLNLSNRQIAKELDLCVSDVREMTTQLREWIAAKRPEVYFEGEVEFDEVYVVAGHKGNPEEVKKESSRKEKSTQRRQRKRDIREKEKLPAFGMIQRNGELFINMLQNVQQNVIGPIIKAVIKPGTLIYTDEYAIMIV